MKIHTDKLTREDLYAHLPAGVRLDLVPVDRRSDLPVIIGTTWRQINEAAADLRKSKQWD